MPEHPATSRDRWPYLRPYKRWIPIGLITIAIAALATSAEIWLFQLVVDDVLMPGDLGALAISDSALTLGGLLVFITYLNRMFGPVRDVGALMEALFDAAAGADQRPQWRRQIDPGQAAPAAV